MALIKCKDCPKKFSTDAKACPFCGANPPNDALVTEKKPMSRTKKVLIALFFAWVFASFLLVVFKPSEQKEREALAYKKQGERYDIYDQCGSAIKAKLKDPDSAKLQSADEHIRVPVQKITESEYATVFEVRAKNSFGAYVKKDLWCVFEKTVSGSVKVIRVDG